jgi:hypothetical protein
MTRVFGLGLIVGIVLVQVPSVAADHRTLTGFVPYLSVERTEINILEDNRSSFSGLFTLSPGDAGKTPHAVNIQFSSSPSIFVPRDVTWLDSRRWPVGSVFTPPEDVREFIITFSVESTAQRGTYVSLSARLGSVERKTGLWVGPNELVSLTVPGSVVDQSQVTGTVSLRYPAQRSFPVSLTSSRADLLAVPPSVSVPVGQKDQTFSAIAAKITCP